MNPEKMIPDSYAMPHALGPEKAVLSKLLSDPERYAARITEEGITEQHFHLPGHRIVYRMAMEMVSRGQEVELISFVQRLLDEGKLDQVGGPAAVVDLHHYAMVDYGFTRHIEVLKEKCISRQLLECCTRTVTEIYDSPGEAHRILEEAERTIMRIRDQGVAIHTQATSRELMAGLVDELQDYLSGKELPRGLQTGFTELDRLSGGLRAGEMFVIGARPSMGKTALMMNIVENIAVGENAPCLVFTAEMPNQALARRELYARARFDQARLHRGEKLTKGELLRIRQAAVTLADARIFYDERACPTIGYIRARARRMKLEHGIQLVAIDYLGLIRPDAAQPYQSHEREIAEISSGIKGMAKDLGIHVILLAQLNRQTENRNGREDRGQPRMSDLKGSGGIEADADMIGLLYRDAYYADNDADRSAKQGSASLTLAKNRNGATGTVPLTFIQEYTRFENGSPHTGPEPSQPRSRHAY